MLPRSSRLHLSADFTEVVRRGRRASRPLLTVHLLAPDEALDAASDAFAVRRPARAGLVVGKGVGGSAVRSTVSRRLRHLLRTRVGDLPGGTRLVVRAAPASAGAPSGLLARDLDAALERAGRPRSSR